MIHQEYLAKLVFENLGVEYIDEQIAKLQQLHLDRVVPDERLLIYIERLSQGVFKVKAFVGTSDGKNQPYRNFRYEENNKAQSILHDIAVYVDEQFQEPELSKYVDKFDMELGVLFGFTGEYREIGQQSFSWLTKSRCNSNAESL